MKIKNPILPGFHPDPSIIRVDENYYLATSTFEWYPGVLIYHSTDLANWTLVARPLSRSSQLDMTGEANSRGIYAPCLSHSNGTFYLTYTDVKKVSLNHNYIVTTQDILGEWSDPIYLNSRGIDPSLFHDEDGRKWLVQVMGSGELLSSFVSEEDFYLSRTLRNASRTITNYVWHQHSLPFTKDPVSRGISIQEYDAEKQILIGKNVRIIKPDIGIIEGPHLYQRDGYYHLLCAEGGTGFEHCVTMARSKGILGPYERHPQNPILSARKTQNRLQKAGHADLVDTPKGETYMVHLCSRPLKKKTGSVLGRETAIQKVYWGEDHWLKMASGNTQPEMEVDTPIDAIPQKSISRNIRHQFNDSILPLDLQWLRNEKTKSAFSLDARKGFLRIYGRDFLSSNFETSLIAKRQQAFIYQAETKIEFAPTELEQSAGLVVMYHNRLYYYLNIRLDKRRNTVLNITSRNKEKTKFYAFKDITLPPSQAIYLKAEVSNKHLQFLYSYDGEQWHKAGKQLSMLPLCDEHTFGFTGAFVGLHCVDSVERKNHADFEYFSYQENPS